MILANAMVMDNSFTLKALDIEIEDNKVKALYERDGEQAKERMCAGEYVDLKGMFVLPGFIDTHIHGANGQRISDVDPDLNRITGFEATQGVTGLALTTASSRLEDLYTQIRTGAEAAGKTEGARIVGIHAEGPFLNKKYKGAMNEKNILAPDTEALKKMVEQGKGLLKLITVAPETENACDFIKTAVDMGLVVTMGHTNATYDEVMRALEAGTHRTTHTFNAMRPLNHREPGILGAAMTCPDIECEVICDYVHLHPATVKLLYLVKGPDRLIMVSDSGHAAGLNVTEFEVDGIMRYVRDGVVRLEDGTIAGSARTLLDGVRNLYRDGIPLEHISRMASYNPARSIGLDHLMGSIEVGKLADFAVLDKKLNIVRTYVDGKCVYCSREV